ncbi:hypothetical protein [Sorangium sp. So ce542]|uniref:hypothetical protein n=1 Tax=Sorangium sp. So ce542 TaxID=3133316 RepID=UPI003F5DAA44
MFLAIAAVCSAFAVGCTEGAPYESSIEGEQDEVFGEAQQALGEAGCAKYTLTSTGTKHGITRSTAGVQTSPDWTYDASTSDSTTTCPYQYIVEYTNIAPAQPDARLRVWASLASPWDVDDIETEDDCERVEVETGIYVWNTNTTNPSTTYTNIQTGSWDGTSCNRVFSGTEPFDVAGKHKVRVAARARYCLGVGCPSTPLTTNLRVRTEAVWLPD